MQTRGWAKAITGAVFLFASLTAHSSGWLICQLAPGVSGSAIASHYKIELRDSSEPAPFFLFWIPDSRTPDDLQIAMRFDLRIVWAEDNVDVEMPEHVGGGKGSSIGVVTDPYAFYNLNEHALEQVAWAAPDEFGVPTPVRIGIIDTGLAGLERTYWTKRVVASANLIEPGRRAYDRPWNRDSNGNGVADEGVGHGTMVASIIGQMTVSFPLVIVRAADSDGTANSWTLTKGIAFAATNGCRVINLSLGSVDRVSALSHVLDWTENQNIICVGAAGNNGIETEFFPSSYSNAIGVSAVDPGDVKATFSNWHGSIDAAAPGTGIKAKFWRGDYAAGSGTSYAAPFVSAGIAIGYAFNPLVTVDQIRHVIESSGDDIDDLNGPYRGKLGTRLNITRLVELLRGG